MYSSIRHGTANKTAVPPPVAPPIPSALPPIKNEFGPPPVRRVSATNTRSTVAQKTASPPPPPPPRPRVEEPQVEGDWAEALYDYSSEVCFSRIRGTWNCVRDSKYSFWKGPPAIGGQANSRADVA
ncbi:hypothetical protein NM688_g8541 [Phlebia brevispora]|uniref:Uncharacterized protein n=1 Tax=Phlebia brevispora TaxID=194682 RepID=A0ACC1RS39_9APHY|nr:hypothetical protein NM688_g8541 [Phlebia brevispora]